MIFPLPKGERWGGGEERVRTTEMRRGVEGRKSRVEDSSCAQREDSIRTAPATTGASRTSESYPSRCPSSRTDLARENGLLSPTLSSRGGEGDVLRRGRGLQRGHS